MNRQVSQLANRMSKTAVDDNKTTASSHTESSEEGAPAKKIKTGSNRTNSALTRRKKASNESK